MYIIFLLISVSVLVASGFLAGFIWAVRSGQYNDTFSPAIRMLFEDNETQEKKGEDQDSKTEDILNNVTKQ